MPPPHKNNTDLLHSLQKKLRQSFLDAKNMIISSRYNGEKAAQFLCQVTDDILISLFKYHFTPEQLNQTCFVAIGGYGRGLMAPFSDIDLSIMTNSLHVDNEESVRRFLYDLWDLKLKIGYSIGTIAEIIYSCEADIIKRTAHLERRFLFGNPMIFQQFSEKYKQLQANTIIEFTNAKLKEREERHRKSGNSRYLVEPDLKNGKGGIRDINVIIWIAKYSYQTENINELIDYNVFSEKDYHLMQKSNRLFWSIRILIHLELNRAHEKINFDIQQKLATALNYKDAGGLSSVERFMRHYFLAARQVGSITRIFITALEAKNYAPTKFSERLKKLWQRINLIDNDFCLLQGRLSFKSHIILSQTPEKAVLFFKYADQHDLALHPQAFRLIKENIHHFNDNFRNKPEPFHIFRDILCNANHIENVLRDMSEAGLLGRLIPDFGKIICLMQFNMYHHYTVDEHLIYCMEYMHKIAKGLMTAEHPLASDIINKLDMKDVLFLSVFVHDMAKGRPDDHSSEGVKIIEWLAPRMGFNKAETETAKWLVLYHLKMSDVSQKRDLSDPQVHKDFASFVRSSERLKLLLCLTVADIRGVGPGVWNGWKGELLRTLYNNTQEILQGGYITDNKTLRVEFKKKDLLTSNSLNGSDQKLTMNLNKLPDSFWLATDIKTQTKCVSLIQQAISQIISTEIHIYSDEFTAVTEIIIYTPDYSGLFTSLSGSLATSGVTIYDAQLFTDENGNALDIFRIQDIEGKAITDTEHLKRIKKRILETLQEQKTNFQEEKNHIRKKNIFSVNQSVFADTKNVTIDNKGSNSATIIEVTAINRNFLLYDIAHALYSLKVSVTSAHINTYGETAIDVFYIKDRFGLKITDINFLNKIKQMLLLAVE